MIRFLLGHKGGVHILAKPSVNHLIWGLSLYMDINTKQLESLKTILKNDYGIELDNKQLTTLSSKLVRLALLVRKHQERKVAV